MVELIVKVKVKKYLRGIYEGVLVASDFYEVAEKEFMKLLKKACRRAEANARKTVMSKDI